MKHLQTLRRSLYSFLGLSSIVLTMAIAAAPLHGQGATKEEVVLRDTIDAPFGTVWSSLEESMQEMSCGKPQTSKITDPEDELGFYRGQYISDFCILATGEDTTRTYMVQFGALPPIRGGIWITGRVQYKVNIKEIGVRKTVMILRAELSGFEEFITNAVHFWVSNGILERRMRDGILAKVSAKQK